MPGWRQLNGEKHPDDIAKAKALLAEAGHPDGFKAEMMVRQVVEFPDQAVIYKEQLKKIGIELTLKLEESATGFQRYLKGDWVCAPQGKCHFPSSPMPSSAACGCRRVAGRGTPGTVPPQWWQDAYTQQAGEQDQAKRLEILRKMEDYLILEDPGGSAVTYWTAEAGSSTRKSRESTPPGLSGAGTSTRPTGCRHRRHDVRRT